MVGPDGEARCAASDERTPHPELRGRFTGGLHRIWVGAPEAEAEVGFVLAISELEDTRAASLLH